MKPSLLVVFVLLVVGLFLACGTEPGALGASGESESCGARAQKAEQLTRGPFDKTCESEADCTIVQAGNGCARGCSIVLSKTGAEAHTAANKAANDGPCKGFSKDKCPQSGPSCQPPPQGVTCEAGKCSAAQASAAR